MNNIFWIADTHFDHKNICFHAQRKAWLIPNPNYNPEIPYDIRINNPNITKLKEHNEDLIRFWNSRVSYNDIVYIVGDFAWMNHDHFIGALHGKKIMLIGSHDKMNQNTLRNFTEVNNMIQRTINGRLYHICHWAMRSWQGSFSHSSCNIYGHSHARMPEFDNMLAFDVGVDAHDFGPIPMEFIEYKVKTVLEYVKNNGIEAMDGEKGSLKTEFLSPQDRANALRLKNLAMMRKIGIEPFVDENWNIK